MPVALFAKIHAWIQMESTTAKSHVLKHASVHRVFFMKGIGVSTPQIAAASWKVDCTFQ